jgi:hypothetical protein
VSFNLYVLTGERTAIWGNLPESDRPEMQGLVEMFQQGKPIERPLTIKGIDEPDFCVRWGDVRDIWIEG